MKLLKLVAAAVLGLSASFVHAVGMEQFLLQNYGWTIEPSSLRSSWDITCPAKQALPKDSVNFFAGLACIQRDQTYWSVIYWRLPSVDPSAIENMVYKAMSDGLGHGKISCHQEVYPSVPDSVGIMKDCAVPLQQGTFYVSFYHFRIPMPPGGSFIDNDGKKVEDLDFTIWVQNGSNSNPAVKNRIRELVSAIQTAEK